ncbi:LOW QUALITY PROTEIN: hypothetical protein HID58_032501, partial [Brassica napus]
EMNGSNTYSFAHSKISITNFYSRQHHEKLFFDMDTNVIGSTSLNPKNSGRHVDSLLYDISSSENPTSRTHFYFDSESNIGKGSEDGSASTATKYGGVKKIESLTLSLELCSVCGLDAEMNKLTDVPASSLAPEWKTGAESCLQGTERLFKDSFHETRISLQTLQLLPKANRFRVADHSIAIFSHTTLTCWLPFYEDWFWFYSYEDFETNCDLKGDLHGLGFYIAGVADLSCYKKHKTLADVKD